MTSCDVASNICQALLTDAREVGHVEEAAGAAASAGAMEGHDVPPAALASVLHWQVGAA